MTTATTTSGGGSGTAVRFSGALSQVPLAAVFRRIAVEERSGELHVTSPAFSKTVYFDRGFVVFASSDVQDDRLGESMIEAGRISRHEFALASMLMKTTKQKFGEVLVEAGIIPEDELGRYVALQVNRIVLSLFLAKAGDYRFDERPCSVPVELMVSLSVYRILIDGVRRMSRKSLVLAGLPPLDTSLRIVDQPPFTLDVGKLRADEKSVLRAARDGASIRAIVETVGGHEGAALRACYGLLSGGVLEPVAGEPSPRVVNVQEETGTFVLSEIRRKVAVPDEVAPSAEPSPQSVETTSPRSRAPAAGEPAREVAGDAFTLSDLFEWFRSLWDRVRGWFGGSGETSVAETRPEVSERVTSARAPVVEAPASVTKAHEPAASPNDVGVPSWTLTDDSDEKPVSESVGAPSWSLVSDASDEPQESASDTLGVPSWSMKDAPEDVASARVSEPEPTRPAPSSDRLEPPAWSIVNVPDEPDEPEEDTFEPTPAAEVATPFAEEPMVSMDSDLFIEGAIPDDDDSSLLSQIPVEEVEVEVGAEVELSEDEVEIEVELDDEEPLSAAPEPSEAPVAASAPTPEPPRETAPSRASRGPTGASKDYEPDGDDVKATAHEQEMRRMKQSGGEARLLRDVKLHFRMRDWQGAVPLLEQLVVISPGKALYRGMLARAMSRDPSRRKDAEEHFIEALRLSPQDPELHYWLGLYYKSFGLSARALTEFRTALRINPKHEGARKQLGGGGKKDDALGSVLKKLFG